ncbi:unnamed protein product [Linum trigynum]|uniref:Uncharacterized protein n=1 Tax=Linum trigynum TaxID=586398 RepID=A0AAV2FHG6_9ROSI
MTLRSPSGKKRRDHAMNSGVSADETRRGRNGWESRGGPRVELGLLHDLECVGAGGGRDGGSVVDEEDRPHGALPEDLDGDELVHFYLGGGVVFGVAVEQRRRGSEGDSIFWLCSGYGERGSWGWGMFGGGSIIVETTASPAQSPDRRIARPPSRLHHQATSSQPSHCPLLQIAATKKPHHQPR